MATSLVRPRRGKIIGGVCAALAARFGLPKFLVRLAFVIFGVVGMGEVVYNILWVLIPKDAALARLGPRRRRPNTAGLGFAEASVGVAGYSRARREFGVLEALVNQLPIGLDPPDVRIGFFWILVVQTRIGTD